MACDLCYVNFWLVEVVGGRIKTDELRNLSSKNELKRECETQRSQI